MMCCAAARAAFLMSVQDLPGALSGEEVRAALGLDSIQDRHWKIQVSQAAAAARSMHMNMFYPTLDA
jgi:hypothetical protein